MFRAAWFLANRTQRASTPLSGSNHLSADDSCVLISLSVMWHDSYKLANIYNPKPLWNNTFLDSSQTHLELSQLLLSTKLNWKIPWLSCCMIKGSGSHFVLGNNLFLCSEGLSRKLEPFSSLCLYCAHGPIWVDTYLFPQFSQISESVLLHSVQIVNFSRCPSGEFWG